MVNDDLTSAQIKCNGCGNLISVGTVRIEGSQADAYAATNIVDSATDIGNEAAPAKAAPAMVTAPSVYDILAPAQQADEIGRLGPFRVLRVLGIGGMGVVYKAEDPQLKRPVALKAILPTMGANDLARRRFLREAQTAAALVHDHIVPILQVGEDRGIPFMAMQFLEGEPLDERLKRAGRLPLSEIVRISREIAEGLAAAHEKGLVHRDIKPANIWLEGKKGRVKILDFGLARSAEDDTQISKSGAILGTPAFMAPEQAAGENIDQRCDLFSLGCVLYCLCTGQVPFKGKNTLAIITALATSTPPSPRALQDDLPQPLSDLVMRLLAKKPEDRPQSALAVLDALREIERQPLTGDTATLAPKPQVVDGADTHSIRLPQPRIAPTGKKSLPWLWLAVGVVTVAIVGLLVALRPWEPKTDPARQTAENPRLVTQPTEQPKQIPLVPANDSIPKTQPEGLPAKFTNSLGMDFVLVGKGTAWLGGGHNKVEGKPQVIPHDFYLGAYEVTQEEWEKIFGSNPSYFKAVPGVAKEDMKRFPVEDISWDDAQEFVAKLNERDQRPGWIYRLPTEAEWEYACRGGPQTGKSDSDFDFYLTKPARQLLPEEANFDNGNGVRRTCKVGSYAPNRLGLYDMHGNVWEWCADDVVTDPQQPSLAPLRAVRGGSWPNEASTCTATSRLVRAPIYRDNNYGLRLARVPVGKKQ